MAELAGIGIDWYTRLEQGRSIGPSTTTLAALSDALRLNEVDRAHLMRIASQGVRYGHAREQIDDTIHRLLDSLGSPAYIMGQRWDVLAWNAAADTMFEFSSHDAEKRNVLHHMLTAPVAKTLFGPTWEGEARRMVALFRATYDLWAGDPSFVALIEILLDESPVFSEWWSTHDVRQPVSGTKSLYPPFSEDPVRYEYATFQANDDPDLRLTLYTSL